MIIELLHDLPSLALVGMAKNVGKTTVLNRIIYENCKLGKSGRVLALTSIGRDGETVDVTTGGEKPRVYVTKGTVVATAVTAMRNSDALLEIVDDTPCRTPLGQVMLAEVREDGFVELAGPSTAPELRALKQQICNRFPTALFIIDGALSRLAAAGGEVTAGAVLCTGAAVSSSIAKCVDRTVASAKYLQCEEVAEPFHSIFSKSSARAVAVVQENGGLVAKSFDSPTLLGKQHDVLALLDYATEAVLLRGAVTSEVMRPLLASGKLKQKMLVVEDGTRLFVNAEIGAQIKQQELQIRVLRTISLRAITVNPIVPKRTTVDGAALVAELQKKVNVPVIDVGRSWIV